jgi:hypothetical protein
VLNHCGAFILDINNLMERDVEYMVLLVCMSRKKLVLISLAIIVSVFYFYNSLSRPRVEIHKFIGSIISIDNEMITLNGTFNGPQGTIPEKLLNRRDFTFYVDNTTQFEKIDFFLPYWEDLTAGGETSGTYNLEDIDSVQGAGSLDDLNESLSEGSITIEASFIDSIYKLQNPIASRVFYRVLVEPPLPSGFQDNE